MENTPVLCPAIQHTGHICNRKVKQGQKYCGYHKKLENKDLIHTNIDIDILDNNIINKIEDQFKKYISKEEIYKITDKISYENTEYILDSINKIDIMRDNQQFSLFIYLTTKSNNDPCIELNRIKNDPMLLKNIDKRIFTFKKIDLIALENNWWLESAETRLTNLFYDKITDTLEANGNIYLYTSQIKKIIEEIINNKEDYKYIIDDLIEKLFIKIDINENNKIFEVYAFKDYYKKEQSIYEIIKQNINTFYLNYETIKNIVFQFNNKLTEEQYKVIFNCLNNNISIVQGKPGTGKTSYIIKTIIEYNKKNNIQTICLTPTHLAKKKLLEDLGNIDITCLTAHSATYMYEKTDSTDYTCKLYDFIENIHNRVDIIVDEAGMVNLPIFYSIIKMIKKYKVKLILCGDIKQLPPIGPGQVFKDLYYSNKIICSDLIYNFRAQNTDIPTFLDNSFNQNNYATLGIKENYKNIHLYNKSNKQTLINKLEKKLLKLKQNGYSLFDGQYKDKTIGIITPSLKHPFIKEFYSIIRKIFYNNDNLHNKDICKGDSIIFTTNTSLFKNGDYGYIDKIYDKYTYDVIVINPGILDTKIDNDIILLNRELNLYRISKNYFDLSFILTVHKAQGQGFDKVIYISTIYESPTFVTKNLNYTAISRAKEDTYLFGSLKNFSNQYESDKNTTLKHLFNNTIIINNLNNDITDSDSDSESDSDI